MGHPTATEAGEAVRSAGIKHLILTNLRSSGFVDPKVLAAEIGSASGVPVKVANEFDIFDLRASVALSVGRSPPRCFN